MLEQTKYPFLAASAFALCLAVSERPTGLTSGGLVSTAHAIVGRPLTPMSVAGVARRTVRRCAVGVYHC
jgi:hypothetical protein